MTMLRAPKWHRSLAVGLKKHVYIDVTVHYYLFFSAQGLHLSARRSPLPSTGGMAYWKTRKFPAGSVQFYARFITILVACCCS